MSFINVNPEGNVEVASEDTDGVLSIGEIFDFALTYLGLEALGAGEVKVEFFVQDYGLFTFYVTGSLIGGQNVIEGPYCVEAGNVFVAGARAGMVVCG